jgi:hypothetical protein
MISGRSCAIQNTVSHYSPVIIAPFVDQFIVPASRKKMVAALCAFHGGFARILLQMNVAHGSSELGGDRFKLVGPNAPAAGGRKAPRHEIASRIPRTAVPLNDYLTLPPTANDERTRPIGHPYCKHHLARERTAKVGEITYGDS